MGKKYIDADVLVKKMLERGWRHPDETTREFVEDDLPAADVVERPKEADYTVENALKQKAERRGRWIENEFGAYCSECGLYAYRSNGIPWKSNYCPICGASMMDDNAIQHTKCVGNALDALDEVEE